MVTYKLVISDPKTGLSAQREVKDPESKAFMGKKIGQSIKGDLFGLAGYDFLITGGSDFCGFPMRADVSGIARKRILAVSGVGIKKKGKGIRQRKTVCGNTIYAQTAQINLKVSAYGKENIFAGAETKAKKKKEKKIKKEKPEKEEKKVEEKKEEKVKEEKKEERVKEEKREEKVKEEKKEVKKEKTKEKKEKTKE